MQITLTNLSSMQMTRYLRYLIGLATVILVGCNGTDKAKSIS